MWTFIKQLRHPLRLSWIWILACTFGAAASAEGLPEGKPVRIVVITAPGGSADATARLLAERLRPRLKRTVIVENRPGAGGNLATAEVARSAADGTSILLTSNNHNVNPLIFKQAGYETKDLVPLALLARGPCVLVVHPSLAARSLAQYIEISKKEHVFYGTYGTGGAAHLAGELLKTATGAGLEHVPYKGAGPALTDTVAGQVPSAVLSLFSAYPQIKAGKLRAIAVFSSSRSPSAPDIPTAIESGAPGVTYDIYLGLFLPKGTPQDLVRMLNRQVRAVLAEPDVAERLKQQGMTPADATPEDFAAYLKQDDAIVSRLVKASGIHVD